MSEKEMTALATSVGADAGQPFNNIHTDIITQTEEENKGFDDFSYDFQREWLLANDTSYLKTVTILGHTLVERFYRNNIRCNIMVAAGSTIALCINAFMTYLLAPTLATKYAIDGIELLLMPLSIIILSVCSHLLGRIMTKRFMFIKLTGW